MFRVPQNFEFYFPNTFEKTPLLNSAIVLAATPIVFAIYSSNFLAPHNAMVALAFLMPIVASMGGNAGMQTLAVTIRALATKELTSGNLGKIVFKELGICGDTVRLPLVGASHNLKKKIASFVASF